jgi:hypothetical protein
MTRVALLRPAPDPVYGEPDVPGLADRLDRLALDLQEHEIEAKLIPPVGNRLGRITDGVLRRRGLTPRLAEVPIRAARLLPGRYDVVHAFTPLDAVVAGLWARATGGVSVLTWTEAPERALLADRRLKLRIVGEAVTTSDAVRAGSANIAAALTRWLAMDAPVLELAEVAGHAGLYRALLAGRS